MKKYVLLEGRNSCIRLNTKDEADITERLNHLKSEGADLDNFAVTEIDTERQPPLRRTAREWLELNTPREADISGTAGKNRFTRAVHLVDLWRSRLNKFFGGI